MARSFNLLVCPCTMLIYVALSSFNLSTVLSRPAPIAPDHDEYKYLIWEPLYKNILTAYKKAQDHYVDLEKIWTGTEYTMHREILLKHCFGAVSAEDDAEISKNIGILASPTSYVATNDVSEAMGPKNHETMAYVWYDTTPRRVTFTALFHKQTPEVQAATVLHESTHVLLDTYDIFLKESPYTQQKKLPTRDVEKYMYGYEGGGLRILAEKAPGVTKYNADAYAVAAVLASRIIGERGRERIKVALHRDWAFATTRIALLAQAKAHIARLARQGSRVRGKLR